MSNECFMVKVNADLTEGRGPMINRSCLPSLSKAIECAKSQTGIMGRHKRWPGIDTEIERWDLDSGQLVSRITFEYKWDKLTIVEKDYKNQLSKGD